jgi:molybdenum cofactor cytidylyltransferase
VVVRNQEYALGRASSVRAGAAAVPDGTEACLLLNVDQPRSADTVRRLMDAHFRNRGMLTVPSYQGRRGHPVVCSGRLLPELREVTEEHQGLRAVMHQYEAERIEVPFESDEVLWDLNDQESYARARSAWRPI